MDDISFSFIIPVYNRPNEIRELLESLVHQTFKEPFKVVIIEDGSTIDSQSEVEAYQDKLDITYLPKKNSGPGDSRNYGMERAQGNYFIVLDSDCILPSGYLQEVKNSLDGHFVHCFGGPDAAHDSFTDIQKAINYAMTSVLTTGGIRGGKSSVDKFQPRSFNMGISKEAFEKVGGYGKIHPGEDPDLTMRIWDKGYETKLIPEAFVYHKRRIDWHKFFVQVNKFGMVRPILNQWHPGSAKITYWFPTLFLMGFTVALFLLAFNVIWPIGVYLLYFIVLFVDSLLKNKSVWVAFLSLLAVGIQFLGYGVGFLKSIFWINFSKKKPKELFPNLFFN
ncbi:glycosyltransferase [Maribacter polysaccharolyticus]|uniref:glycosyltransferase n=1 Tax=Maribacter polysaccharolyticus TaxID=3020831 RepID=UPI00237FD19E|nr:glycosyltransferase [Maribacter polysaccharolyticus]MDE3740653.1 glycosyltransferase [Maribacter polysaccharolyticus]